MLTSTVQDEFSARCIVCLDRTLLRHKFTEMACIKLLFFIFEKLRRSFISYLKGAVSSVRRLLSLMKTIQESLRG
jgi:hypothetical protein